MNPNAREFMPTNNGTTRTSTSGAWTNQAKSIHIAKLPRRSSEKSKTNEEKSLSASQKTPKVLSQPVKLDEDIEDGDWVTVGSSKKAIIEEKPKMDLTEEELERQRNRRRERRKNEKINKKLKKQEEKLRLRIESSKDTKVKLVRNVQQSSMPSKSVEKQPLNKHSKAPIRFFDEEYPTLGASSIANPPIMNEKKVNDSGSDWETEDEKDDESRNEDHQQLDDENKKIEIVEDQPSSSKSFSSILKKSNKKQSNPVLQELSDVIESTSNINAAASKKVKKKDPITFDIMAALQSTTKLDKTKKVNKVLGSKIQPQVIAVKNILDSTAPTKRRGKERENPKKKKLTKMKQLILLSRQNRKEINEKLHQCKSETVIKEIMPVETQAEENEDPIFTGDKQEMTAASTNEIELSHLEKAKTMLHSRKFRNYCDHFLSEELDTCVKQLLQDVVRFQDRQFAKDPVKAKAKRRYVVGLREIKKFLQVRKITLLILAPDIETVKIKGGLDDTIEELIELAKLNSIPYIFSMNRWRLGKACLRKVPISGIGILNYQGSDENYLKIKQILPDLHHNYVNELANALKNVNAPEDIIQSMLANIEI